MSRKTTEQMSGWDAKGTAAASAFDWTWIPTQTAAALLEVSHRRLLNLVHATEIYAELIDGQLCVASDSLRAYAGK